MKNIIKNISKMYQKIHDKAFEYSFIAFMILVIFIGLPITVLTVFLSLLFWVNIICFLFF